MAISLRFLFPITIDTKDIMKRVFLFLATNLAIMLVLGITASLLGVNRYLTANGLDMGSLLVFSAVVGFTGAFF